MKTLRCLIMAVLFSIATIFGAWAFDGTRQAQPRQNQEQFEKETGDKYAKRYRRRRYRKRSLNRDIHRYNKRIRMRKQRNNRRALRAFAHHNRGCFISTLTEE